MAKNNDTQRDMITGASRRVSEGLIKALAEKATPKTLTGMVGQVTKNGDLVLWKPSETPADGYSCRTWPEVTEAIEALTGWKVKEEQQVLSAKLH